MNPVAAWHEEHAYFNRLLHLLHEEVSILRAGGVPRYELMLDILSYLRGYGDQVHHPREDEAFRRLALRKSGRSKVVTALQQEHRAIAEAGEALRELLEEVAADTMVSREQIEVAAVNYIVHYRAHMAREEEEVLPAAQEVLTESDWAAAKAAAQVSPLAGPHPEDGFRALRRRIAVEAA